MISTLFPGASSEEVEKLLTNPIEREIHGLSGIRNLISDSMEGRSVITVVMDVDADPARVTKTKAEIREIIERFQSISPQGADKPVLYSLGSGDSPVIEVHIEHGTLPSHSLYQAIDNIKSSIREIPGISEIETISPIKPEIRVEASEAKLHQFNVSLGDVTKALNEHNVSIPGGALLNYPSLDSEKSVWMSGQLLTPEDIGSVVLRANELGKPIRVGDIAEVTHSIEPLRLFSHTNAQRTTRLNVLKKEKTDALTLVAEIKSRLDELKPQLPETLKYSFINDQSSLIERRLSMLYSNFLIGLVLVLGILSLFLPFRIALIVSSCLCLSFLGTMLCFYWAGYSLNLISLLGLIIVSGMLVDDAVVVADACLRKLEGGASPEEAAVEGAHQVWLPDVTSTLSIILAFFPMAMMSGVFGKFVKEMPIAVIISLLFSLITSLFILPGLFVLVFRKLNKEEIKTFINRKNRFEGLVTSIYMKALKFCIARRYAFMSLLALLVVGSLALAYAKMPFVLFPSGDSDSFSIQMKTPSGTILNRTEALVAPVEMAVCKLPKSELKDFITTVGFQYDHGGYHHLYGSEYAEIVVQLVPLEERKRTNEEILSQLKTELGQVNGFEMMSFIPLSDGPPVGRPVNLAIKGNEYGAVAPLVEHFKKFLSGVKGVTDIQSSDALGKEGIRLRLAASEAAASGVGISDTGTIIRAATDGYIATKVHHLGEESPVRVILKPSARVDLKKLTVTNSSAQLISLSHLIHEEPVKLLSRYEHHAGKRQIQVFANIDEAQTTSTEVNGALRQEWQKIQKNFPGLAVNFGGEDADTRESMASMGIAFLAALLGIFVCLILTFKQLLQSFLVFLAIPLGIVSVIWAFLAHGKPMTFMGILGVVALSGVVVNAAIYFLDLSNDLRKENPDRRATIFEAARLRLRPILLSALTTVIGVVPTAYGIGGLDPFVTYVALALSWGLLLGTGLTLLAVPCALAILDDARAGEFNFVSKLVLKIKKRFPSLFEGKGVALAE